MTQPNTSTSVRKFPRISFGWACYFAFLAILVLFGIHFSRNSMKESKEFTRNLHNELITNYDQLYCFNAAQGSDSWKAARAYLMTNHPDSLTCQFSSGRP